MVVKAKSFSNLVIVSLVVLLLGIVCSSLFLVFGIIYIIFGFLFYMVSLFLSIIGLIWVRKNNLRGKGLAVTVLVISSLLIIIYILIVAFVFFMIASAFSPQEVYYYDVPMKVIVNARDYSVEEIRGFEGNPDIYIVTSGEEEFIPKNCSLDNFIFFPEHYWGYVNPTRDVGPTNSRGYYGGRNTYTRGAYPNVTIHDLTLALNEPGNEKGRSEKLLKAGEDEFYMKYTVHPFASAQTTHYGKEATPLVGGDGCVVLKGWEDYYFEFNDHQVKNLIENEKIVCLKYGVGRVKSNMTNEGCKYFKVKSVIEVSANLDLNMGISREEIVVPHI